ncbi:hypothetical protein, partial [Mesorhizobium sp.]|uniref:hypothetical protein n=1 Tax=Mesorhizobium sp. TaxID=1871066 RepID=UPI0025FA5623
GEQVKRHPLWPDIDAQKLSLAERLAPLGGDALGAVAVSKEIHRLDASIDRLVDALAADGSSR